MSADSSRDSFPRQYARTQRFTLGEPRHLVLFEDHGMFLRSDGGSDAIHHLWHVDVPTGVETKLVDARALLADDDDQNLPPAERARRERLREGAGGITAFATDDSGTTAVFTIAGRLFVAELSPPTLDIGADDVDGPIDKARHGTVRAHTVEIDVVGAVFDPRPNRDASLIACVVDRELRVLDRAGDVVFSQVDDDPDVTWGSADFVAAEEMGRYRGYWWSPDGTSLAMCRNDNHEVQRWFVSNPAQPAAPPVEHRYPRAGTANPAVTLWIANGVRAGSAAGSARVGLVNVELPGEAEYLAAVRWNRSGLAVTTQSRSQRDLWVQKVDPNTGASSDLAHHRDPAWVELVPGAGVMRNDAEVVTVADRDGARRLLINDVAVSPVEVQIRSTVSVTPTSIVVTGNPIADPTVVHVYSYDGATFAALTTEPGVHSAVVGPAGVAIRAATLHDPAVTWTLPSGHVLTSVAETPLLQPNVTMLRTGPQSCATALLLPSGRQPEDVVDRAHPPLPVLLDPYGGPHAQRVIRSYHAMCASQWFADQGFAVIVIDGRGTPGRGTDFEREIVGDLADGVLTDQVDGLQDLADRFDCLDTSRVGIRGWSFGGYLAALAALCRPDVFHAAVAGAPVTEWRLYDTHYTERYLGDPVDNAETYDRNSLLTRAGDLRRPLLLIHGLSDDNVVVAHTLQLSTALLEAGRPHEVLPLAGVTHMTPQETVAENLLLHQLNFLERWLNKSSSAGTDLDYGRKLMDDRLNEMYQGVAFSGNADAEHIAALELLVLVMAADDQIDDVEVDEIKAITEDWRDADFDFDKYLQPAIEKARASIAAGQTTEMLDDIDRRISSRLLRRALFSAARDVAGIDDAVSPSEGSILSDVAVRFG